VSFIPFTPSDRPDFRHTEFVNFQDGLEDEIPIKQDLHIRVAIDTCVENPFGAVMQAVTASTPKSRPRDDPRSPIPARIQDEIRLKNWLWRQWRVTRDPALRAGITRL
jgi:hypothetical protein